MKRQQPVYLSVPEPCHENWEEMLPEENGRFCLHCSKTVIDFSAYTDEQLLTYFNLNTSRNICGMFSTEQTEREILPLPQRRFQWASRIFAGIALYFSGLIGNFSFSLSGNNKNRPNWYYAQPFAPNEEKPTQGNNLNGYVYDHQGLPVAGATVQCVNNNSNCLTDEKGYFNIAFSTQNPNEVITLKITKENYTAVDYQSQYNDLPASLRFELLHNSRQSALKGDVRSAPPVADSTNALPPADSTGADSLMPRVIQMAPVIINANPKISVIKGNVVGKLSCPTASYMVVKPAGPIIADPMPVRRITPGDIPDLRVKPAGPEF